MTFLAARPIGEIYRLLGLQVNHSLHISRAEPVTPFPTVSEAEPGYHLPILHAVLTFNILEVTSTLSRPSKPLLIYILVVSIIYSIIGV